MIEGQQVTIFFSIKDEYGITGKLVKVDTFGIIIKVYVQLDSKYKLTLFPWHVVHSVQTYL